MVAPDLTIGTVCTIDTLVVMSLPVICCPVTKIFVAPLGCPRAAESASRIHAVGA
jgi:hypothetical protein